MISGWVPFLLVGLYFCLCIATAVSAQQMLVIFRSKRPDLVNRHMPDAFDHFADPRRLFFFLKSSTAVIFAGDQELLQARKRLILHIWGLVAYVVLLLVLMMVTFFWNYEALRRAHLSDSAQSRKMPP